MRKSKRTKCLFSHTYDFTALLKCLADGFFKRSHPCFIKHLHVSFSSNHSKITSFHLGVILCIDKRGKVYLSKSQAWLAP